MKKRLFSLFFIFLLILGFPLVVSAGGSSDDEITPIYNVKCEYDLVAAHPLDDGKSLTKLWIYVDETNNKHKMTYQNKSSQETELKNDASDYLNYDKLEVQYALRKYSDIFEYFDDAYKNNNGSCPKMYLYTDNPFAYFPYFALHTEYSKGPYKEINPTKKYTSNDGGNTWNSDSSNAPSDKVVDVLSCNYNFLTDVGKEASWPLIASIKFQKQRNQTKQQDIYNLYFEYEDNGTKYNSENLNVVETGSTTTYVGQERGQTFVIYASLETVKSIFAGTGCLDASKVYFYDYGDWAGYSRYDVTTNYNEAEENSIHEIYNGKSGTDLLNAKREYDNAVKALKDAMKKHADNNWSETVTEECKSLFGGISDGSNQLIKNYKKAKEKLKNAWSRFDFSDGDKTLESFKSYTCGPTGEFNGGQPIYGCEVIPQEIRDWIRDALNLVKYIALAIVIVLGVLDFLKAAGSGEAETMKKSGNDFLKRIIAVIILFLVPVIVELILNLVEIFGAKGTCI